MKSTFLQCTPCGREFSIVNGVPDFFISETIEETIDEANKTWLDPMIVQARDTVYRLCARELKGMAFCMREIGRQTASKCRVLEVGMGTGHFTRWLAEVSKPGTEIFAFDFSWPIIEKAKTNTQGLAGVKLLRANARGRLPFQDEYFDIVFARLAPLGAKGIPNVQAGYQFLRPGGWYFGAGWEQGRYDTAPTEWALQHGYDHAEYHEWQYRRVQSPDEYFAWQIEQEHLAAHGCHKAKPHTGDIEFIPGSNDYVQKMTYEHLLMAHKPLSR